VAEILLFHHALGLTDGIRAYADGVRHAEDEIGFDAIIARGREAAERVCWARTLRSEV